MFIKENVDQKYLEPMFIYMVISTLLGARLGEVFFYNWDYFQNHLLEILLPIKEKADGGYSFIGFRGLASHGAAIGVLTGIFIFQKLNPFKPLIWILDRLTIPAAIGGVFIRTGNFFNSEIVGKYTGSNFGVVFENRGEILPRYPAQMYEAFGYFILFLYSRKSTTVDIEIKGIPHGSLFRRNFYYPFFVEYVKESQGGFEEIFPALSTGQWLSIPFITFGLITSALSFLKKFITL